MDKRIAREGYQTQTQLSGQTRLGGSLYAGYRWPSLSLEVAYVDLGSMTTRVSGTSPVTDDYLLAISRSHPQSGSGPQFSATGYLPIHERMELFAQGGVFYWRSNMSANGRSRYRAVDDRSFDPMLAVGMNYRLSQRWAAHAQWSGYRLAGEHVNTLSLGLSYRWPGRSPR